MKKDKFILDACCGGRMFWFNKKHPNVIYQDIRQDILPLKEQYGMNFSVEPDVIGDFTKMNYKDSSFKLVIFDPPHLILNRTSWMSKKYGTLKGINYKEYLKRGFNECWRVLKSYGILIFKWNDNCINISEIKDLFPCNPLIYNRIKSKGKNTYWFVFMKIPKQNKKEKSNEFLK